MIGDDARHQRTELAVNLRTGHVLAHARHYLQVPAGAARPRLRRVVAERPPDLRFRQQRALERGRHYADYGPLHSIGVDRLSNDRRVAAESPRPEPVADDDDVPCVGRVFRLEKVAAEHWPNAERSEELPAHYLAGHAFGVLRAEQSRLPVTEGCRAGQRLRTAAQILEGGVAGEARRSVPLPLVDRYQVLRLRVWQRAKNHRVDDAVDRRRRPDCDRERCGAEHGEAAGARESANGAPDV